MMIPILKDYYAPGYLPSPSPRHLPPYLPNVNLAVRRRMVEEAGGYDEACSAGEDADLCIRAAQVGWAQFYEPRARAFHEPRKTLPSLIRQWSWYGKGGSHFFFKQQRHCLEVYLNADLTPKMHGYRRVLSLRWFPVPVMIFISSFLLAHLVAVSGMLALAVGFRTAALAAFAAAVLLPVCLYRGSRLSRLSWTELPLYAGVAYLINWTCIASSFMAGLKKKRIFIYPGI